MATNRYNWKKLNINSGNPLDVRLALESAFTAIDDSIAQRAIDECCFITFRGSGGARFLNRGDISGRHLIILREDYFGREWEDSRLDLVVPIILHALAHYALNHKETDLTDKHSEKEREADKLKREWVKVWKEARGYDRK